MIDKINQEKSEKTARSISNGINSSRGNIEGVKRIIAEGWQRDGYEPGTRERVPALDLYGTLRRHSEALKTLRGEIDENRTITNEEKAQLQDEIARSFQSIGETLAEFPTGDELKKEIFEK